MHRSPASVHLLRQAVADQQGLLRESLVPRKAGLALGRVFGVAAVRQGQPEPARRLGHVVHVVLLQLLEVLHVGVQELLSPVGGRRGAVVGLVAGPAQHVRGIPVLRPLGLGLFAVPLPGLRVLVDGPRHVGVVGAVLAEQLPSTLRAQLLHLEQRRELVVALDEQLPGTSGTNDVHAASICVRFATPCLEVHVQGAALLALDGAVDGVHAPEDAAAGRGVAAEGVHAGCLGAGAVRALEAAPHSEEVAHGQLHEDAEAVVIGKLRLQGLGVQLEELHVQPWLVAGLERLAGVGSQGRVRLSTPRQAQHEGGVPFGRREGHEERRAVADPIGVGLVPHGVSHLVRAGNVAASGVEVGQHLLQEQQDE